MARGGHKEWLGITHDPTLDSAVLAHEGYTELNVITPILPIGILLYIWKKLWHEDAGGFDGRSRYWLTEGRWPSHATQGCNGQPNRQRNRQPNQQRSWWTGPLDWATKQSAWWKQKSRSFLDDLQASWNNRLPDRRDDQRDDHRHDPAIKPWLSQVIALLRKVDAPAAGDRQPYPVHIYRINREQGVPFTVEQARQVAMAMEGRLLFMNEVEKAVAECVQGAPSNGLPLEDILQVLALLGVIQVFASVELKAPGQGQCMRCGETENVLLSSCVRCGRSHCMACEACAAMGEARLCRPLYGMAGDEQWLERWDHDVEPRLRLICRPSRTDKQRAAAPGYSPNEPPPGMHWPQLTFKLTPAQAAASQRVEATLMHRTMATPGAVGRVTSEATPIHDIAATDTREEPGSPQGVLVWAACGAGKTEVVFGSIAQVLRAGGRVLFAIPRRDVVLELEPRIQQAFPGASVGALYGGSSEKYIRRQIVIATTHQAIRCFHSFDLVVLDEADAFPYQGSAMLHQAVLRARKRQGRSVYMTATPDIVLKEAVAARQLALVTIPARHHGRPLPEPEILLEKKWNWQKDQLIFPEKLLHFLHRSVEGDVAQVFLFVPSVFLAQRVGTSLQVATRLPPFNDFKGIWVEYSHSRDPERESKRQRFSRQAFPIFVTTAIMERGITVPRANVVVLFAENERIFDERALIQMAGRAGRSSERPDGTVWFVGTRKTSAMQEALTSIRWLNEEARKKGFLASSITQQPAETTQKEDNVWAHGIVDGRLPGLREHW
ncbi:competence protein ComFA [Heliophilum fasciatum]|uniref:Competence protein ComFA n=1 Tax=Heliophilum fasciatum TaxID=35700 RepID=A0A4V2SWY0_9FIRM|nr:competence protein ComFA [Heliophilum fasciatum]